MSSYKEIADRATYWIVSNHSAKVRNEVIGNLEKFCGDLGLNSTAVKAGLAQYDAIRYEGWTIQRKTHDDTREMLLKHGFKLRVKERKVILTIPVDDAIKTPEDLAFEELEKTLRLRAKEKEDESIRKDKGVRKGKNG
jgi:hypothetical protein